MTPTTHPFWASPIKLPDGHRLFQADTIPPALKAYLPPSIQIPRGGGVWAMADESGSYPEETDDGILWLDFGRDLNAGPSGGPSGIPLLDPSGKSVSTITDTATLLRLSARFDWRINCLGRIMRVIEA